METAGLIGVLALWGIFGLVPWYVALIAARGRLPFLALPLAFAAGIGGGALVPALGAKGFAGFWLSLAVAVLGGAAASLGMLQLTRRRAARV